MWGMAIALPLLFVAGALDRLQTNGGY